VETIVKVALEDWAVQAQQKEVDAREVKVDNWLIRSGSGNV
jgi:hypothetical protein